MIREVDTRGSLCPEPVLAAHRTLRTMAPGERMRLLADDPVAEIDVTHFCRSRGHVLLEVERREAVFVFVIQRSGS